ncbi:ACT domain-containing protein [Tenacibaculum aestuariivivum]|uniref:ACT domain-containing protein n=1 Tax=Tenacibaculum aestuariivivum TaxID=2006131 RepID=UPI003AB5D5CF
MSEEKILKTLIQKMKPHLNNGEYIFTTVNTINKIAVNDIIGQFKENEGITLILERQKADKLNFKYNFIASWITLEIYSSLDAVGLTAIFSTELAKHNISCNVVAGFYHDHIFIDKKDEDKAISVLTNLSNNYK